MSRCSSYVDEFERLTERIGYWIDTEHAYYTYHPCYVESVWWNLKQLFERGLLYEDYKVIPYCPRCETGLSSHELGQPGVYYDETRRERVRPLSPDRRGQTRDDLGQPSHLAVWTTTPWTLISNVAVAVNPEVTYAVVDGVVVAADLIESVFGEGATPPRHFPGSTLFGLHYERPFNDVPLPEGVDANYVVAADYVTTEDGTGLVHQSPGIRRDRPTDRARKRAAHPQSRLARRHV